MLSRQELPAREKIAEFAKNTARIAGLVRPARGREPEKRQKSVREAAFFVTNPPLRWGKPSGDGINRQNHLREVEFRGQWKCLADLKSV